jgi:hypothetical protein
VTSRWIGRLPARLWSVRSAPSGRLTALARVCDNVIASGVGWLNPRTPNWSNYLPAANNTSPSHRNVALGELA